MDSGVKKKRIFLTAALGIAGCTNTLRGEIEAAALRALREGWVQSAGSRPWLRWLLGAVLLGLLLAVVTSYIRQWRQGTRKVQNPYQLFYELLAELELSESECKALRRMAREGRLKHPAMSLLSPKLFAWAKQVWISERGLSRIDKADLETIDRAAIKLFRETAEAADKPVEAGIDLKLVHGERSTTAVVQPEEVGTAPRVILEEAEESRR